MGLTNPTDRLTNPPTQNRHPPSPSPLINPIQTENPNQPPNRRLLLTSCPQQQQNNHKSQILPTDPLTIAVAANPTKPAQIPTQCICHTNCLNPTKSPSFPYATTSLT